MSQISLNQVAYMFLISLMSIIVTFKLNSSCSNLLPPSCPAPKLISIYQLLIIVREKTGCKKKCTDLSSIGGFWKGDKLFHLGTKFGS